MLRIDFPTKLRLFSKNTNNWPPFHIWLAALLASCLRALPFLWLIMQAPERKGLFYLPIAYIPKDWLAYTALIHQSAYKSTLFLSNPFTTDMQDGRFIFLFHQALGAIHASTGANVFWLLEFSRFPLIIIFMLVLWRFLAPILPDRSHRSWACWLVAFSGGLEFFLLVIIKGLPVPASTIHTIAQDLWSMYGWNTFQSFFNPLWITALILLLLILRPILQPEGLSNKKSQLWICIGLVILWFTHPYSAILVFAVIAVYFFLMWCLEEKINTMFIRSILPASLLGLAIIAAITFWQMGDEVFKRSSGNILGSQIAPFFWYPLTLGVVGFFSFRGWWKWISIKHKWLLGISSWIIAVMMMQSSTIFNGYKYIMYLHIPICIMAAPVLADYYARFKQQSRHAIRFSIIMILLFISCFTVTMSSILNTYQLGIPKSYMTVIDVLKHLPEGNVLCPQQMGNIIPSFTSNRVFLGQWFMTPDAEMKSRIYDAIVQNPSAYSNEILNALAVQKIRYLIIPSGSAENIKTVLRGMIHDVSLHDGWALFILKNNY